MSTLVDDLRTLGNTFRDAATAITNLEQELGMATRLLEDGIGASTTAEERQKWRARVNDFLMNV